MNAVVTKKRKWVEQADAGAPFEEVARAALDRRLSYVWKCAPEAAKHAGKPESVHQLRVASRRAIAALELFESLLPKNRADWMRRRLKRLRKAAGEARDLDVLIDRLEHGRSKGDATFDQLLSDVRRLRGDAQPAIVKACRKLEDKNFPKRQAALLKRVWERSERIPEQVNPGADKDDNKDDNNDEGNFEGKADGGGDAIHTYHEAARGRLRPLIGEFLSHAADDFNDHDSLHAFRIQGKQVRYALELFGGALGPAFAQRVYPLVEKLQEKLGAVNDRYTACLFWTAWRERLTEREPASGNGDLLALIERFEREETAATNHAADRFIAWWTAERRGELANAFEDSLA